MNRKSKITDILKQKFELYRCVVSDVSVSHKGHSGFIPGEETHFEIIIISNEFEGSLHSITFKLMTISESREN